ncbi:MAG: putative ABC transporter permease subunit [Chloroflexota bacterium]
MSGLSRDAWVLARLRFKLLTRSALSRYTRSSRLAAPFRLGLVLLFAFWALFIVALPLALLLTSSLHGEEGRHALTAWLSFAGSGIAVLVFFYAILTLVGTFTYRSDLKLLLMTPLSPRLVLASKLGGVSLGFSTLLVVAIPALIAAGTQLQLGVPFVIATVLCVLLLPVAPVSLATLAVLAVLRFIPPARARTATTVMGTLLGATVFIGQQLLLGSRRHLATRSLAPPHLPDALPSTWIGHVLALMGTGPVSQALVYGFGTLALDVVLFLLAIEAAARLFQTGAGSYQEVTRRKRSHGGRTSMHPAAPGRVPSFRRPTWSPLVYKEWLLLRRDPQLLAAMAYPLIIIGFYFWRLVGSNSGAGARGIFSGSLYGILILAAVLLLNSVAPTVVNREGRSLYLLGLAPLSPLDILLSKWAISVVPPLLMVEALLVAGAALLRVPVANAILVALVLAGLTIALAGVSISINLIWPRFNAPNPRQGSKSAAFAGMGLEFVLAGIAFGLLHVAFALWNDRLGLALLAFLTLLVLLAGTAGLAGWAGSRLLGRLLTGDKQAR